MLSDNDLKSQDTSMEYRKVMSYLGNLNFNRKYLDVDKESSRTANVSPSEKRIEILRKIQNLCQDEDNYNEFEKVLQDYIGSSIEPN